MPGSCNARCRVVVGAVVIGLVLWALFFRDIAVQPDKKPGPVNPELRPLQHLSTAWSANEAANWMASEYLAQMSLAAYGDLNQAKEAAGKLGLDSVRPLVSRSMAGYVAWHGKVMVIAFRGSEYEIEDWIVNCDCFKPDPTENGGIHAGFNQAYVKMRREIHELIDANNPEFVWLTGHSLGGALATVCATDLMTKDSRYPHGLITFGQPMVATLDLANHLHRKLDGRFVHFANRADPIPRLPSFTYRHFGSLALFDVDGVGRRWDVYKDIPGAQKVRATEVDRNDIPPMTPEELGELQERIRNEKVQRQSTPDVRYGWTVPSLSAHDMELYLANIRRWVTRKQPTGVLPPPAPKTNSGIGDMPRER